MESTTDSPLPSLPPLGRALPVQIIFGVIAGGVTLLTLLGNTSVLCAFARTRRLHTYANFYIVSLATADLLVGILVIPFNGTYWLLGYWPFGETICFLYKMIGTYIFHITYLNTLVIAVDRYLSIAYPIKHLTYRNAKVALTVIFLIYFIPVILWVPFFCYWMFIYEHYVVYTKILLPNVPGKYLCHRWVYLCY